MDVKTLTTFVHAAELGSFSKAAERLGYAQPTISVQIRQLEEELGYRLFDRIGHCVRLTDRGHEALVHAQQICRISRQMSADTSDGGAKETLIRLATADSLSGELLTRVMPRLRAQYPWIQLHMTTAATAGLFQMLDQNEADVVCTLDSHIYNTNYVIAGEKKVTSHFVVSSQSDLAEKEYLTQKDLMSRAFLLTEKGMSYRRLLDEWLARDSMEIRPVLETGRADLICSLVEAGEGISFLPDYVTEDAVKRGTVVRLDAEGFKPDLWKQVLYHRDKWISPALQMFVDLMVGTM